MVSQKPWKAEAIVQLLLGMFVCMSVGVLVVQFLVPGGASATGKWKMVAMLVNALCLHGGTLALIAYFVNEHGLKWREAFGFSSRRRLAVALAVMTACVAYPVMMLLIELSGAIMTAFHSEPSIQQSVQVLQATESVNERLYFGMLAVFLAPVVEETLFRGILYPFIKQAGHPHLALWGTSFLFALIHFNAVTFVPLAVLAVMLTALYETTNNLLAPILTHGLFNAANFASIFFQAQINDFINR